MVGPARHAQGQGQAFVVARQILCDTSWRHPHPFFGWGFLHVRTKENIVAGTDLNIGDLTVTVSFGSVTAALLVAIKIAVEHGDSTAALDYSRAYRELTQ